jgi:hypothetical protein
MPSINESVWPGYVTKSGYLWEGASPSSQLEAERDQAIAAYKELSELFCERGSEKAASNLLAHTMKKRAELELKGDSSEEKLNKDTLPRVNQ